MSYFTIIKESCVQFEERKSIFIGHAKRVETEEAAKEFVNKIKSEHKDATHNVYAYIVGENMLIQKCTDDGEPQGTAGVPVLDVIKKNGITDTAIVVTRYFGGILLGTGGLVRAYSKGASEAVNDSGIVERVKGSAINIITSYELLGKIQYHFSIKNWHIENIEYTDKVKIVFICETQYLEAIKRDLLELCSGKCEFKIEEEKYYFKAKNRLVME
ncbi:YigZ family protein [Clostridium guangxiense]|uniref:YigZ family protein n=1 Tax=Clostridium guangxiense TaxID=1662055 RepID=UPI001E294A66|nr:YigZ family protein [Clostridium guangxiense]MCD2345335.1 YigZ family protein [Clostridium guangxiense]